MVYSELERASREEIENLQLKRLKDTLKRVESLSKFYKKSFKKKNLKIDNIQSLDDIQKFPFTTKNDLRENYPFGLFCVPMRDIVRLHSSSGTTGKPTVVGYTKADIDIWDNLMVRVYKMAGVGANDTLHNAYSYGLFTGGLGFHNGACRVGATVVPVSGGFSSRQLMLMRDFGATVLASTPSFALHLAELAKKENINFKKDYKLRVGLFGAEPASKTLKDRVAEAWGIEYFEVYGVSELIGPGVSCNCSKSDDLHIFEDHFFAEIIDPKSGKVLDEDEEGELVVTTLTKEALPIIRYRTGDITSLSRKQCSCGRTTVQMKSIIGRVDDMIIINGVNIFPSQIEYIIASVDGLSLNYQIVADKRGYLDSLEIAVEVDDSVDFSQENQKDRIEKELFNKFLNNLYINTSIKLLKSGTIKYNSGKVTRVVDKRAV